MSQKSWKRFIVPSIFITVFLFAVVFTALQQRPVNDYPDTLTPLLASDFVITGSNPELRVGESDLGDVSLQFPGGNMLGRSGVYRPADEKLLFTFTRKTNLLNKMDILGPGMATARAVSVNDSFDQVLAQYGPGFVRSYYKSNPQIFDAIYGEEQCIVFHVENNVVKRIVVIHETD